jgi:methionyl-tRNA formyltransferase
VTDERADSSRVRTVFIGSGAFGVPTLRMLAGYPSVELVGVVTAPPRAAGRKAILTSTPIGEAAARLHLDAVLTPDRLRSPKAIADVLGLHPALVVLADYGQIVPLALLELPHGALNLHPSLLPRHRGATPIPAAILRGDAETGVSLMSMDEGLDTGPIVAAERIDLDGTEVAPELEDRLASLGAGLLERGLAPWIAGRLTPRPQSDEGATVTRQLRRADGRLDPSRGARELERQVRAYQPWPGSFVDTSHGRLVVWRATVRPGPADAPGSFTDEGLGTADGLLALEDVQPGGGERMSWSAYVRGRPAIVGSAVVPAG